MKGIAAAVIGVLVASVLGACAPSDGAVDLPDGVSVELVQLRSDVAGRTAQIRVINESDVNLTVTSLAVHDSRFEGEATRDKVTVIEAGRTVALRFELPPAACTSADGEPVADEGEASVTLLYGTIDGSFTSTAVLVEPLGFVPRLHDRECLRQRLTSVVGLEWTGFTPSASGVPAVLTLGLTPSGSGTAVIAGIRTSNLLKFTIDGDDDLVLDATAGGSDDASSIDVPLVPWRCDPHAVQEDKRGTVFTVDVEVDGRSGPIEVAASPELRGEILQWVARWCGFAE